jgi:4-amino-4-deoxy-L-arabinose transferase-like glycosyltransferase
MRLETFLIIIIAISLVLNLFFIHPTFSDDNFYFNVGKKVSEGMVPYRDFFFAHSPLQIYTLAILFRIFGNSYFIAKLYSLLISALCLPMIYLIAKELNGKKTALIATFAFLFTTAFIAFSSMGYGMWEATLFVLISTYFLLKDRPVYSSFSFLIAVLFRYIAAFYFPFLILIFYLRNGKPLKFFLSSFILLSFCFAALFLIFGQSYLEQTIFYHFFSKVETARVTQYWEIGLFSYFLALISVTALFIEKDRINLLFATVTLVLDPIILLVFKLSFYHYFLISLPFCIIAASKTITIKDRKSVV